MIGEMFRQDLATLSLFQGLTPQQLQLLEGLLEYCNFTSGQVIFQQGQQAERLFILLAGQVEVQYKPYDGDSLTVAVIEPGGVFGWSAALGRHSYTSAAIAITASDACTIRGSQLHHLCDQHPETGAVLLDRLAGVIAERLRNTHEQVLAILSQGVDPANECMQ